LWNEATIVNEPVDSNNHLKDVVEQSLAVLGDGQRCAGTKPQAQTSLRSALPLHVDRANLQKRALTDAATALAALWKISKPRRVKLPPRVQFSRSTT
jgi:hypothetical protein